MHEVHKCAVVDTAWVFNYLKRALSSNPCLRLPDYRQPFWEQLCHRNIPVQKHKSHYRPAAYYSRCLYPVLGVISCLRAVAAVAFLFCTRCYGSWLCGLCSTFSFGYLEHFCYSAHDGSLWLRLWGDHSQAPTKMKALTQTIFFLWWIKMVYMTVVFIETWDKTSCRH